jgi:hypothetical protein
MVARFIQKYWRGKALETRQCGYRIRQFAVVELRISRPFGVSSIIETQPGTTSATWSKKERTPKPNPCRDSVRKASQNCRVASQHEFRCRVLCDVSNGLPSSPPVKKVHELALSGFRFSGHIYLLKRARFLDSRTPGPICFVPGFPAQF